MKLKAGILIVLAARSLVAAAGVGAHGGNVVECPNQPSVTLDDFNAALPVASGPVAVVDVGQMTEDQSFKFIRSRFDGSPFQVIFDVHTKRLGPIAQWIAADLKSIDDSNEPYALPSNCARVTGAARQGSSMYIDPSVLKRLSPGQLGLLHAHEVLYEISRLDSSAAVRDLFRVMLARTFDPDLMNQKMLLMDQKFAAWNYLGGGSWTKDPKSRGNFPGEFVHPAPEGDEPNIEYYWNQYSIVGHYEMDCMLATQSCVFKTRIVTRGSPPDIVGCTLTVPDLLTMTITCPKSGSVPTIFHKN